MKTWIFIIFILAFVSVSIPAQNSNAQNKEEKPPRIEIRANSRTQIAVVRDNYHRRRDLRFLHMNKKMRFTKRQMKAYYISQARKNRDGVNMQKKAIQQKAIQRKQLQRQRQQMKQRRIR
ncbi:hypothetical protein [Plebeiibacterium marinum]|uniref:Uncharacterized protein n=1 Tax=Plebeiibacterium marinum TaxID=2992111 RepID=A0AAE3MCV1_9BACT|nr:hypothetical protein [Plebeiobacterium marinum]MCW3805096.1 hypothetical protein [Plebeiobacterium marinum]